MNCPICRQKLGEPHKENGSVKYVCNCIGFTRVVIEILPEEKLEEEKGLKHDRSNRKDA